MITFAILILIVAKALPGLNTHISSIHVTRITSIVFLFAGILSLNCLNLESIGSGIGIYSGFFQVTTISQLIEIFLFMIGGGILVAWPQIKHSPSGSFHPSTSLVYPAKSKIYAAQPLLERVYIDSIATAGIVPPFLVAATALAKWGSVGALPTDTTVGDKCSANSEATGGKFISPGQPFGGSFANATATCVATDTATATATQGGSNYFGYCYAATPSECGVGKANTPALALTTEKYSTDYSLVVLFSSLGSSLLISSYDLISVYLSIELQSFGLYVLSTLYRDSESSTKAGLKYFLLGGLSSCIILLGTGIIYSYTGTTNLESLYIINSVIIDMPAAQHQQYIIQGISLGLSLIFIGFLFKIAAAPLHNWSPDVYDGTPTIVTTWLTIIPKIAILFILLELQIKLGYCLSGDLSTQFTISEGENLSSAVLAIMPAPGGGTSPTYGTYGSYGSYGSGGCSNLSIGSSFQGGGALREIKTIIVNSSSYAATPSECGYILKSLLLISATLSLIIGSLLGLAQIKIKRLLAYSTISHLGFILLALAVNTEQSIDSFIFYIIQYTITNLNIFLVILGLTYCLSTNYSPAKQSGVGKANTPALATSPFNHSEGAHFASAVADPAKKEEAQPILGGHYLPPQGGNSYFFGVAGGWALLRNSSEGNKDISLISEFKGLFFSNPLLSISLAVSLFSMAGIPPLIGFFSKQLVLYSAIQNGYYFISVLAIIVSVISCSYYLQIIKILLTHSPHSATSPSNSAPSLLAGAVGPTYGTYGSYGSEPHKWAGAIESHYPYGPYGWIKKNVIILTNTHSYLISTLTFTILLFFIKPSLILNSTQLLSLSLFYI